MSLDDIRKDIDSIDLQIRELIMKRLDCSKRVIQSKIEDGNYVIYRADREAAILDRLGEGIPQDRRPGYLAVVRKITETSRMYQYGILYDEMNQLVAPLMEGVSIPEDCRTVRLVLTRPNIPNAMSSILSMIGDYGYNMSEMKLLGYSDNNSQVQFELALLGNLHEEKMRRLMLQLSMESTDFRIISAESQES